MTTLSVLPKIVDKRKKRRGRGLSSGQGAKSGRGTTRHQKARTSIPLHFEGGQNKLTKKFPLLRGKSRNKRVGKKPLTVRLSKLNSLQPNTVVDVKVLIESKIVNKNAETAGVKIVAGGKLNIVLDIRVPMSKGAIAQINPASQENSTKKIKKIIT